MPVSQHRDVRMSNTLSRQTDERAGAANPYPGGDAADDLCVRLSGEGMLRVDGDDARDFLHRQFSTSLLAPGDDHAGLSSYSDPRGRVLAVPRTLPLAGASVGLLMPAELIAPIRERLIRSAAPVRTHAPLDRPTRPHRPPPPCPGGAARTRARHRDGQPPYPRAPLPLRSTPCAASQPSQNLPPVYSPTCGRAARSSRMNCLATPSQAKSARTH